jgi:hypothetical protein
MPGGSLDLVRVRDGNHEALRAMGSGLQSGDGATRTLRQATDEIPEILRMRGIFIAFKMSRGYFSSIQNPT